MSKLIFISYRRDDAGAAAGGLKENLERAFGPESVFMDTSSIRIGEDWPERLRAALRAADVLLVVMGRNWLRLRDEYWRRRLDAEGDWVREEILEALARGIKVIPVLVEGATPLPSQALPFTIRKLNFKQAVELRETSWETDLTRLTDELVASGFVRTGEPYDFPAPADKIPRPLSEKEIVSALAGRPGWRLENSPLPGQYPRTRTELKRAY